MNAIRTRIAFPDDICPSFKIFRVHDVHNLGNLVGVKILQKLIFAQGLFDQMLGPEISIHYVTIRIGKQLNTINYYSKKLKITKSSYLIDLDCLGSSIGVSDGVEHSPDTPFFLSSRSVVDCGDGTSN